MERLRFWRKTEGKKPAEIVHVFFFQNVTSCKNREMVLLTQKTSQRVFFVLDASLQRQRRFFAPKKTSGLVMRERLEGPPPWNNKILFI